MYRVVFVPGAIRGNQIRESRENCTIKCVTATNTCKRSKQRRRANCDDFAEGMACFSTPTLYLLHLLVHDCSKPSAFEITGEKAAQEET